jgi:hypothetical protein
MFYDADRLIWLFASARETALYVSDVTVLMQIGDQNNNVKYLNNKKRTR